MPQSLVTLARTAPLLLVLLGHLGGCATHRLVVDEPNPATGYEDATLTAYFWGTIEREEVAENCLDHALDEVRVRTNPAYALVTVITLGIVVPVEVQWKCRKLPPQVGEF